MNNFNIREIKQNKLTYWSLNYIVKKEKKKDVKEGKICMSANTTNTRELYFTIKNSFDNIWNKKIVIKIWNKQVFVAVFFAFN